MLPRSVSAREKRDMDTPTDTPIAPQFAVAPEHEDPEPHQLAGLFPLLDDRSNPYLSGSRVKA